MTSATIYNRTLEELIGVSIKDTKKDYILKFLKEGLRK